MLQSHECSERFLQSLPTKDAKEVAKRLERIAPAKERRGNQMEQYRLIELISEGAGDSVWIAQQTQGIESSFLHPKIHYKKTTDLCTRTGDITRHCNNFGDLFIHPTREIVSAD